VKVLYAKTRQDGSGLNGEGARTGRGDGNCPISIPTTKKNPFKNLRPLRRGSRRGRGFYEDNDN